MDNIYKAVQLTIDSQNLALSKTPTHVYIANQYVDTNDTPLITAPFIIQKALENGTGVVDIVSSTIGSIYEVRLLCDAEVLISGYFYMPPMNVNFSELELYTSYPPRTPPVVNEFWQKTENFILEKTNTLLNFVQVFNSLSSMRLSLGCLEELLTTKKSNLVSAINEVYKRYEGVGDLYEKNVEAGAGANGWIATFIADESGMTQQQVNDKTALFYNTVADMVVDTKLKAGKAVITHGYYSPNDGGGARYLIKDTATDYSIPVANNLHAVFADSFDIRKFGIRNNATLDQTTEIQRMVNYADTRIYEIDFLNYKLMTPKTWDRNMFGGVMGLTFYYPHAIKNLFITHDKTRRLENGHCLINFLPIKNPAFEIYFALENVTFDAWVDNYQKVTDNYNGNYDGMRHGLFCHPAKGSDIPAWGHTPSNISFRFKNIRFTSPAYSYNLTPSGVFSKNTYIENVDGEFLGLYLNFHTKNLHVKNMHGIYRHDYLEEGRLLVLNLIHYEAELGAVANVTFDEIFVENASCYRVNSGSSIADKEIWSVFKWHNIGSGNTINKATFINVNGTNIIQGVVTKEIVYKDSKRMSFALNKSQNSSDNLPNITVDNCNIYSDKSTFGTMVFLARESLNNLTVKNSKLYVSIFVTGGGPTTINKLSLENVSVDESSDSLIGIGNCTINLLLIDTLHLRTGQSVFWLNVKKTIANNIYIDGEKPVGGLFRSSDDATGTIVVNNLQCSGTTTAAWTYIFEGFASVLIKHSYLNVPYITRTNIKDYKQLSVIPEQRPFTINYDPPSLATATQQSTTVTLTGAKLGDNINVSFNQPLQGTRMWGEVTAPNTVMVHHRNDTGVAVDLPSGTLTVKIV